MRRRGHALRRRYGHGYVRVPITRIVIRKRPWRADAFDANGHLRSRVTGYADVHTPTSESQRQYVEAKVAEFWPGVPVEYVED